MLTLNAERAKRLVEPLQLQQEPARLLSLNIVHAARQEPVVVVRLSVKPYVGSTEARSFSTEKARNGLLGWPRNNS
jgi:hypothetical protein